MTFSSVYRLQLTEEFPFAKAKELLPYLKSLGIDAIYTSPFYEAVSSHGYDITNPNRLNPKLGTDKEFETFSHTLRSLNLKWIIDVVPNHMGIKGGGNLWWQSVLEEGPHSEHASFFDIDFNPEKRELQDKVLLPILGECYGAALERGEIALHTIEGKPYLKYLEATLPLAKNSVLGLPEGILSFDQLDDLLEKQFYRVAYWRVAKHEINYRRFFNVNELVAIRIEDKKVLEAHHQWVFKLLEDKTIDGLRIDHPDGLYDPVGYFKEIKKRFNTFVVVEKILDRKESLPESWEVEGSVGYEFINVLNGLFIRQDQERDFTEYYETFIERKIDFEKLLYDKKKIFARFEMASEVNSLGFKLDRLSEKWPYFRDFTRYDLTRALQEVIACFPVYRTYIALKGKVNKREVRYTQIAIEKAKHKNEDLDPSIFDFLEDLLLCRLHLKETREIREFVLRFQQLTGPIMAKGLEDTCFYVFNRFISLNEVGGDPTHFGTSVEEFHKFNRDKLKKWPLGFLPTSTHDTKRSEDVRARLNVISECLENWQLNVKKWALVNAKHKTKTENGLFPSLNTEYFIYQTLLGAWTEDKNPTKAFQERLWKAILKSIREAREETSWSHPNEAYETATRHFFDALFDTSKELSFLSLFLPFQRHIAQFGKLNSLSQVALKIGSCGVVDLYQGNEVCQLALVDPDNRRPVDYPHLKTLLEMAQKKLPEISSDLIKPFITTKALQFRSQYSSLFLYGDYVALKARGPKKGHVIAFMRKEEERLVIVIVGRFLASMGLSKDAMPLQESAWGTTELLLPKEFEGTSLIDLFTKTTFHLSQPTLLLAEVFDSLTVAYLAPHEMCC